MGKPMTLLFDPYEAICLFLAGPFISVALNVPRSLTPPIVTVLTVNYVVQDGKSNWVR
jgi:Ca2+/H+ antiporter